MPLERVAGEPPEKVEEPLFALDALFTNARLPEEALALKKYLSVFGAGKCPPNPPD